MPPKLEPLFRIKLIQGTQPTFRSPYRMVAIEQKELKKQIGYLIAKGFIRQVSCFEQLLRYLWRRRTEQKSLVCIIEDLIRTESLLISGMFLLWSSRRDRRLPWMFEVFLVLLVTIVGFFRIFPPLQSRR